jgi:hypothetical protein
VLFLDNFKSIAIQEYVSWPKPRVFVKLAFAIYTALVKLIFVNSFVAIVAILSLISCGVAFNFCIWVLEPATISCLLSLIKDTTVASMLKHKTEF